MMNFSVRSESPPLYCKSLQPDTDMTKTVKEVVPLVIGGLGILNNVFIIIIAARYTVRKNLHHLIVNMSVSDTLVVLMICIDNIRNVLKGWWNRKFVTAISVLRETSILITLVTLLIISVERFRITRRKRVQRSQPYTLKQRVAVTVCTWLAAMTLSSPRVLSSSHIIFKISSQTHFAVFAIQRILLMTCYCVIVVLSIVTLKRLSQPQAIHDNLSERQRELHKKRMVNAVSMVLSSLLLYSCCYLPEHTLFFFLLLVVKVDKILMSKILCLIDFLSLYFVLGVIFPLVNSCLSPYIYISFLSDFREATKRLLCKREVSNQHIERRNSLEMNVIQH